jgi:hypothetical protein
MLNRLLAIFLITSLWCLTITSSAQSITPPAAPTTHQDPFQYATRGPYPKIGETVEIVRVSRPGKRTKCLLQSFSSEGLVCAPHGLHHGFRLPDSDVAAILSPADYSGEHFFYIAMAVAVAGTIVAGFFLPVWGAVLIGIPAILFAMGSAMGTDGDTGENILYQRPGTPLTVKLH